MIIEYARPKTITEAVNLLNRETPITVPLGGGSVVSKHHGRQMAVVDLQDLDLNQIRSENGKTIIGATSTLSQIEAFYKSSAIAQAIQIQAGKNQRNSGTIAGLVKMADGRSPLLTLLLALDAQLNWEPRNKSISLGNWLPIRSEWKESSLITKIVVPEEKVVFESIARTPKDIPIICCAIALWPNGRMRVTLGGFGKIPNLVLDGTKNDDIGIAVYSALRDSDDQWASAEYRREAGQKLALRLFSDILAEKQ